MASISFNTSAAHACFKATTSTSSASLPSRCAMIVSSRRMLLAWSLTIRALALETAAKCPYCGTKGRNTGTNSDTGERSEEHTSELQLRFDLVCRLLLEKKKHKIIQ